MTIKKFTKYLLIYICFSFSISFKIFPHNFNEDILRLVFAFFLFVFFSTSDSVAGSFDTSGSVAGSGVGSRVGILSKFLLEIICF